MARPFKSGRHAEFSLRPPRALPVVFQSKASLLIFQGKSLAERILRGFLGRPARIFLDSDKSKALLKLGLPQLGLSRFHVIMLRCVRLKFARQCHCHGQIVNLLYL